jgi:hypothetical protein
MFNRLSTIFRNVRLPMIALLLPSVASAEAFEVVRAAPGASAELAPLPTVGIAPRSRGPLSTAVANHLTRIVENELASIPEGNLFRVVTRASDAGTRWAFVARPDGRTGYEPLVPRFTSLLLQCLRSLPNASVELATANLVLRGVNLPDADAQASATTAAQQMAAAWRVRRCNPQNNTFAFEQSRLTAVARAMITGQFDALSFAGQNVLELIELLTPLFHEQGGLWQVDRGSALVEIFQRSLRGSSIPASARALVEDEFPGFFHWSAAVATGAPAFEADNVFAIAVACLDSLEEAAAPFTLADCIAQRRVATVSVEFGTESFVSLAPRSGS